MTSSSSILSFTSSALSADDFNGDSFDGLSVSSGSTSTEAFTDVDAQTEKQLLTTVFLNVAHFGRIKHDDLFQRLADTKTEHSTITLRTVFADSNAFAEWIAARQFIFYMPRKSDFMENRSPEFAEAVVNLARQLKTRDRMDSSTLLNFVNSRIAANFEFGTALFGIYSDVYERQKRLLKQLFKQLGPIFSLEGETVKLSELALTVPSLWRPQLLPRDLNVNDAGGKPKPFYDRSRIYVVRGKVVSSLDNYCRVDIPHAPFKDQRVYVLGKNINVTEHLVKDVFPVSSFAQALVHHTSNTNRNRFNAVYMDVLEELIKGKRRLLQNYRAKRSDRVSAEEAELQDYISRNAGITPGLLHHLQLEKNLLESIRSALSTPKTPDELRASLGSLVEDVPELARIVRQRGHFVELRGEGEDMNKLHLVSQENYSAALTLFKILYDARPRGLTRDELGARLVDTDDSILEDFTMKYLHDIFYGLFTHYKEFVLFDLDSPRRVSLIGTVLADLDGSNIYLPINS